MKVSVYTADLRSELPMRYAEGGVRAGFPSPAQDYETEAIDLNKELVRHPATTFYARAYGDSMHDSAAGGRYCSGFCRWRIYIEAYTYG